MLGLGWSVRTECCNHRFITQSNYRNLTATAAAAQSGSTGRVVTKVNNSLRSIVYEPRVQHAWRILEPGTRVVCWSPASRRHGSAQIPL